MGGLAEFSTACIHGVYTDGLEGYPQAIGGNLKGDL
jgi:hypothetical protein